MKRISIALLALLLATIVGCSKSGDNSTGPPDPPPEEVVKHKIGYGWTINRATATHTVTYLDSLGYSHSSSAMTGYVSYYMKVGDNYSLQIHAKSHITDALSFSLTVYKDGNVLRQDGFSSGGNSGSALIKTITLSGRVPE